MGVAGCMTATLLAAGVSLGWPGAAVEACVIGGILAFAFAALLRGQWARTLAQVVARQEDARQARSGNTVLPANRLDAALRFLAQTQWALAAASLLLGCFCTMGLGVLAAGGAGVAWAVAAGVAARAIRVTPRVASGAA